MNFFLKLLLNYLIAFYFFKECPFYSWIGPANLTLSKLNYIKLTSVRNQLKIKKNKILLKKTQNKIIYV